MTGAAIVRTVCCGPGLLLRGSLPVSFSDMGCEEYSAEYETEAGDDDGDDEGFS